MLKGDGSQAAEALRLSEERFRSMVEQSPLSVQVLSPDGRTLRVNRAWEELWGVALADVEGYNVLEDQQLVQKGVMPYIRKGFAGEPTRIPPIVYDPDETIPGLSAHESPHRWVRAWIYPVNDEAGRVREVTLIHEDITERKRAEDALARSEQRYRAVVEQTAEGIYLIDAETGRVMESNAALERMLGYTAEELAGMVIYDLIAHDRRSIESNLGRTVADGQRFVGERRYRRKDGTLVDVEVGASVISYGEREAVCAVLRDVSGRKNAERAAAEIREAERRRISRDLHDMVLQDLAAALQTMQADLVEEAAARGGAAGPSSQPDTAIGALRRALRGLRDVVHDLRPDRERPFVGLVESLVELNRQMSPEREVSLTVEDGFPCNLPHTVKVELSRIVQEALANARRHSEARRVEVALGIEGNEARMEVYDDGDGFVPESLTGGMGISAMRERAQAVGADLELRTSPGEGTRVIVRVPAPGS